MRDDASRWAWDEFGDAALGDVRRTQRLVALTAAVARRPAGTVTRVLDDAAEREGAYRFLESDLVPSHALQGARHAATARRCASFPFVFVAVDGSSLSVTDRRRARDVGGVGTWSQGARGLQVISAVAVSPRGAPLGLCGQTWWARERPSCSRYKPRDAHAGEHSHAVRVIDDVRETLRHGAPTTRPWFQLDRGYDARLVLEHFLDNDMSFTVRAAHDRRVLVDGRPKSLWSVVSRAKSLGTKVVDIPARDDEPARRARVSVRSKRVEVLLGIGSSCLRTVELTAVLAKEARAGGLEWLLLTSVHARTLGGASLVLDGYASRWRIEDFHRAWKRGLCNVEQTQLRGREALLKWATIHGAVAARALRLAHLARERPDLPASEEFTQDEIDTVLLLRDRRKNVTGKKLGDVPTIAELVRWIADLGGYTGKSSGGPPGATVVGRGLERITFAAQVLALSRSREM